MTDAKKKLPVVYAVFGEDFTLLCGSKELAEREQKEEGGELVLYEPAVARCRTCPSFQKRETWELHGLVSRMLCIRRPGIKGLMPQDGSGFCSFHPENQLIHDNQRQEGGG